MICSLESGVHSNSWTASCAMPLSMEPVAFFLCKSTKSQQQVPPISMQHFSTTDGSRSTTTSTKIHMPRSILQYYRLRYQAAHICSNLLDLICRGHQDLGNAGYLCFSAHTSSCWKKRLLLTH